ncbi:MAG: adenosine deaminase [Bacilli bacterium]|nr:adenosine deaminase [Bacilli bacterium]
MIDLHLHLDGSMSLEDIEYLSKKNGVVFDMTKERLSVDETCTSLNDYLQCFDFPLKLLQDKESIEYSVYSLFNRLAKQGLIYAEVRFAPQLSTIGGLTQEEVVEAAIKGLRKAIDNTSIDGQLILCCMRQEDHDKNIETIKVAKKFLHKGVCAIDLAGAEALFKTRTFAEEFELAKSLGIPFTIHAGEADGPESVWDALKFGASRIGHGVHSLEDPKLIEYLAEHEIPLEICPTSEVDTHCVQNIEGLRLRDFINAGVKLTINTDDMTVSNVDLKGECDLVMKTFHLNNGEMLELWSNSIDAAFLTENEKRKLRAKLGRRL